MVAHHAHQTEQLETRDMKSLPTLMTRPPAFVRSRSVAMMCGQTRRLMWLLCHDGSPHLPEVSGLQFDEVCAVCDVLAPTVATVPVGGAARRPVYSGSPLTEF